MKKSMLVLLALVLALALAVPVFAARMEKVEYTEEYEFELIENCEDYGEGWNFSVWNRGTYSGFEQFFYNNNDEVIKRMYHESGTDNLFRYDDGEKVLSGNWQVSGQWDIISDEIKYTGIFWNIHLPGEGNVFHQAGADFIVGDELVRTVGLDAVDFETICRYFAD